MLDSAVRPALVALLPATPAMRALALVIVIVCQPIAWGQGGPPGTDSVPWFSPDIPPPPEADADRETLLAILGWVGLCIAAVAVLVGLAVLSARVTNLPPRGNDGPVPIISGAAVRRRRATTGPREGSPARR